MTKAKLGISALVTVSKTNDGISKAGGMDNQLTFCEQQRTM